MIKGFEPASQRLLETIAEEVRPELAKGQVAQYIPALAGVPQDSFGMALVTLEGEVFSTGLARQVFSIQSISKLFSLMLAYQREEDTLWQRVGRAPSSSAFNSLIELELEQGKARNPFVNAGALAVVDWLCSRYVQLESAVVSLLRSLSGNPSIDYDLTVAKSELQTASRNRAAAFLMQSYGNLHNPVELVMNAYCKQCAIMMNCVDLASAVRCLANQGVCPSSSLKVVSPSQSRQIAALMMSCGNYSASGEFAYQVGLPAKSGVGGGIVAHIPGYAGVCVWSPGLDSHGTPIAGMKALERLTQYTGQSVFDARILH